ncbi:Uncharacterised nucleotidyltransferase [Streptomyces sp. TLI_053]|uniref:nucleotidyltransferase domain-containing protein n=1 Tax=Streptomyces sp. TLI_053 TaxID=1855352 RepID=UPI00087A9783|nr:nucleotidyltransferase family protein [Streptomyces sp. TLI_053]SDT83346.1 Uncharacterised nucleotidyltransferase [Streptomyces sp. TLI_053]
MAGEESTFKPARAEERLLLALARPELTEEQVAECRTLLSGRSAEFDWGFFVDRAARHRILPLVGRNIARNRLHHAPDGVPLVPYRWLFDSAYFATAQRYQALGEEFGPLLGALNEDGVRYAVRKGPVLGEGLYRDPGLRPMYDLDILIGRADSGRVGDVLRARGFDQGRVAADGRSVEPFARESRIYWKLHVNNEIPYLKLSAHPLVSTFCVDLCLDVSQKHATVRLGVPEILEERIPMTLFGVPAHALSPTHQLIDLCLHLHKEATSRYYVEAGTDLQVLKFLDIALAADGLTAVAGWGPLVDCARACGAAPSVHYALHHTALLYPEAVPPEAVDALGDAGAEPLHEYGAVDGRARRWRTSFGERLFAPSRRDEVEGASTVPRS